MKKILVMCFSFCISLCANAQATDLVVDCQTPGWLSSKINYGDQQTVKNLKVTGYINNTDLKFIGTLIELRNLNGELDLTDCNIVSEVSGGDDNRLVNLGLTKKDSIRVYRIPKSATDAYGCTEKLHVDSMFFDCKMKYVDCNRLGGLDTSIDYLSLGEFIDSIPGQGLINNNRGRGFCGVNDIKRVHFPKTMRYISDLAFMDSGISDINLYELDSLDYIGSFAFVHYSSMGGLSSAYQPDTLWFKAKSVNASAFSYKDGQHIFVGKNVKKIETGADLKHSFGFRGNLIFHMESTTPPSGHYPDASCIVYVPKGSKTAYQNSWWGACTIIEENPVESITLNEHSITLNKNEQFNLSATILPEDADDKSISWESKDTSIASIDEHGTVTAIKEGETQVVVTSIATGIQDLCTVLVRKNVTNISLEEDQIFFNVIGEQKQLVAIITPDDATEKGVTWKSFNEQVCTVSDDGLVTATGIGSTLVTATTVDGGLTVNCVVKVIQHVGKVSLNKVALELKVNESEQLIANVSPDNADNKALTWSSSNNQVATVDANGNVQALKAGEAWIKAVSVDNTEAKDSCKVTVIQPVTGVTISLPTIQFTNIGENIQLEATVLPEDASNKEVTWTSSNESVCMVANGMVVATGYGTAVVMAITKDGGFMASCSVIVEKETIPVTGITLSQTSATLKKGETLQLEATVTPDDATNKTLIWKSSDETKCVVTQSGLLVALTEGQAIITVITENGVGQAQCNVLIVDEGSSISTISVDASKSEMPIYDIMGQRVLHLMKGHLYICNGKKFIAK